jgi:hypothetical protein
MIQWSFHLAPKRHSSVAIKLANAVPSARSRVETMLSVSARCGRSRTSVAQSRPLETLSPIPPSISGGHEREKGNTTARIRVVGGVCSVESNTLGLDLAHENFKQLPKPDFLWRSPPTSGREFAESDANPSRQLVAGTMSAFTLIPDKALVLWVDEKIQIQALERTQPVLPMGFVRFQPDAPTGLGTPPFGTANSA